ncbi:carbonic anhydrase 2-like [Ochlerotatus camptorhynchus]|uniref:carbonic anhydrase 2-like n=1 Tax=Ochlerotatus camptorhynchus TaxID=644619 RepID=UPI0031E256A4
MKVQLVVFVVLGLVLSVLCDEPDYSYGSSGEAEWNTISPQCNGTMQSPIPLSSMTARPGLEMQQLEFTNYQLDPTQVMVTNDGHTAVYSFEFPDGQNFTARGGPLQGTFQFDSLHFHWGASSDRGAEHVVDRRRYAMEMHLVFFNQQYGSLSNAETMENGLFVLGIFLTNSTTEPNYGWLPALNQVQTAGTSYTLPDPTVFNIKQLIGARRRPYFSYHGSLTTPPCYETVSWIVQRKPLPISEAQLNTFRSLRKDNGEPLVDNFRMLQDINGRQIFLYR